MKNGVLAVIISFFVAVFSQDASGISVQLSEKDVTAAVQLGNEQGNSIGKYLEQRYSFGEEKPFEENGVIRTKWSKLALLSGLLTAEGKKITGQDKESILKSTDLQIDIHTFGDRINFAEAYKVLLEQEGKVIEPDNVSASHVTCLHRKGIEDSGFPKYRATVRSFFPYEKIDPLTTAKIILVKDKKKSVFEVNLAQYR